MQEVLAQRKRSMATHETCLYIHSIHSTIERIQAHVDYIYPALKMQLKPKGAFIPPPPYKFANSGGFSTTRSFAREAFQLIATYTRKIIDNPSRGLMGACCFRYSSRHSNLSDVFLPQPPPMHSLSDHDRNRLPLSRRKR